VARFSPIRLLLFVLLAGGFALSAFGQVPPPPPEAPHGLRVFIAGHSFHVPIEPYLQAIAQSAGLKDQVIVGKEFIGGSQVIRIWNDPEGKEAAKQALATGKIDVLTLSPYQLPDDGIGLFVDWGLKYNPALRITLQQSWLPWDSTLALDPDPEHKSVIDHEAMTGTELTLRHAPYRLLLHGLVETLNQAHAKPVLFIVPTADALVALREKIRLGQAPGLKTQGELFQDRMGHPGVVISTLNAYCHFAVIYRRSPVGLPIPLPERADASGFRMNEDLNKLLQQLAWNAVLADPASGVTAAQGK
jgi:hypothetical protein